MEPYLNQLDRSFIIPLYEDQTKPPPLVETSLAINTIPMVSSSETDKMEVEFSYPAETPRLGHEIFTGSLGRAESDVWPKELILSDGSAIIQHVPINFFEEILQIIQNWIEINHYPSKSECFAFLGGVLKYFKTQEIMRFSKVFFQSETSFGFTPLAMSRMSLDKTGEIASGEITPRDYKRIFVLNYFADFFANHLELVNENYGTSWLKNLFNFLWSHSLWTAGLALYIEYLKKNIDSIPLKKNEFCRFIPVARNKNAFFDYSKIIINALRNEDHLWSMSKDLKKVNRHSDHKTINFIEAFKAYVISNSEKVFILDIVNVPVIKEFYIEDSKLYELIKSGNVYFQSIELLLLNNSDLKKIKEIVLDYLVKNIKDKRVDNKEKSLLKIFLLCCLVEIKQSANASLIFSDSEEKSFFNLAGICSTPSYVKNNVWEIYKNVLKAGRLFDFNTY